MDDLISLKREVCSLRTKELDIKFKMQKHKVLSKYLSILAFVLGGIIVGAYIMWQVCENYKIPNELLIRSYIGPLAFVSIVFEIATLIVSSILYPSKLKRELDEHSAMRQKKENKLQRLQSKVSEANNSCNRIIERAHYLISHKYITGAQNLVEKLSRQDSCGKFEIQKEILNHRIAYVKTRLKWQHFENRLVILANGFEEPVLSTLDAGITPFAVLIQSSLEHRIIGHEELAKSLNEKLFEDIQTLKDTIDRYVNGKNSEVDIECAGKVLIYGQRSIEQFYDLENRFFELFIAYKKGIYVNAGVEVIAEIQKVKPGEIRNSFPCFVGLHLFHSQYRIAEKYSSAPSNTLAQLQDRDMKIEELNQKSLNQQRLLQEKESMLDKYRKALEDTDHERVKQELQKACQDLEWYKNEELRRKKDSSHHFKKIKAVFEGHYRNWSPQEPPTMPTQEELQYGYLLADAWCQVNASTEKGPSVLFAKLEEILGGQDWKEQYLSPSSRTAVKYANLYQQNRLPFEIDISLGPSSLARSYAELYKLIAFLYSHQEHLEEN